uniref:Putative secreted protein n=1 Tax=Anopheles darlingi TaxID=43151 RepID=A0A2M4D262_ANODA
MSLPLSRPLLTVTLTSAWVVVVVVGGWVHSNFPIKPHTRPPPCTLSPFLSPSAVRVERREVVDDGCAAPLIGAIDELSPTTVDDDAVDDDDDDGRGHLLAIAQRENRSAGLSPRRRSFDTRPTTHPLLDSSSVFVG